MLIKEYIFLYFFFLFTIVTNVLLQLNWYILENTFVCVL